VSWGEQLVKGPIVVLLGPPGSGKTLQAAAAAKYLNVPVVSVEELIKSNAADFRRARIPGITGMEPQTDPMLNKFSRPGFMRVISPEACSWMVTRTRKIMPTS
jgi:hypothetical protein